MGDARQVIALAGVGDLGRYVCEELHASPDFDVIVLTRAHTPPPWFKSKQISTFTTDYTTASVLSVLESTKATTLISFIGVFDAGYITVHTALLKACQQSTTCKRLIPSEWAGDIDTYPLKPGSYATTREPFRQILRAQTEVAWTLFNVGWLADYFLPTSKTYMKPVPNKFPLIIDEWKACIRGSGDEVQSWVCGRDVGKAVVELCKAVDWEQTTYVAGEWSSFNAAIELLEKLYHKPMPRTRKPWEDTQRVLDAYADKDDVTDELDIAQIEEMMVLSCLACPKEKTLRQREKYFYNVHFRGLEELLQYANAMDFV